jgi:hypothetical protein
MRDDAIYAATLKWVNQAIDDGVVVPAISLAGERVLRTGESRLPRREYYSALPESALDELRKDHTSPSVFFTEEHIREVDCMQRAIENFHS